MNCSDFSKLLDLYIDGELDEKTGKSFREHADACEECREQLRAAEQLRDILSHMDEDIAVPLPAQAAWRSAVRREAGKRKMKFVYRAVGTAAAVCVLTLGITTMLRSEPAAMPAPAAGTTVENAQTLTFVEADGVSSDAVLEASAAPASVRALPVPEPYFETVIATDDALAAREYLADILSEYDGMVEREEDASAGVKVYLRVPGENAADFMKAAAHIGTAAEQPEFAAAEEAESIGICIVFSD